MNKIVLVGRLTKDPELSTTSSGISFCRFNVACSSKQKGENGESKTDFFVCVAWRERADLIFKYCKKGSQLQLSGSMGSRTFDRQDGTRQTVWEMTVDDMEFLSSAENDKTTTDNRQGGVGQQKLVPLEDDGNCPF